VLYDGLLGGTLGLGGGLHEGINARSEQNSFRNAAVSEGLSPSAGDKAYGASLLLDMERSKRAADKEAEAERKESSSKVKSALNYIKEFATNHINTVLDRAAAAKQNSEATSQTNENADLSAKESAPTETPEAAKPAEKAAPVEFNSKSEAEAAEPVVQPAAEPARAVNPQVTNPQVDAKVEAQPETASTVAAQPQEGQDNGKANNGDTQARRDSVPNQRRPGETADSSEHQGTGDGGAVRGSEMASGDNDQKVQSSDEDRVKKATATAKTVSDTIEKRVKGATQNFRNTLLDNLVDLGGAFDSDFVKASKARNADNTAALYTDALLDNLVESGNADLFEGLLVKSGVDKAAAKEIAKEVFENSDAARLFGEEQPSEMKPTNEMKKNLKVGNIEFSEENGKRVATVTKAGDSFKEHIGKDVSTVRIESK
jgi:hypothetical protein